jgi:hypothetical protein
MVLQGKEGLRLAFGVGAWRSASGQLPLTLSDNWKVWRNGGSAGVDGQSVSGFEVQEEQQVLRLSEELRTQSYYFRYSKRNALESVDGWVRGRLRSILRRRAKRQGRARGKDHQRWTNTFFAEAGLFNLTTARYQWTGRQRQ